MFTCSLATAGFWSMPAQDVILQGLTPDRRLAHYISCNHKSWVPPPGKFKRCISPTIFYEAIKPMWSRRRNRMNYNTLVVFPRRKAASKGGFEW